jgi:hypothetical protein
MRDGLVTRDALVSSFWGGGRYEYGITLCTLQSASF